MTAAAPPPLDPLTQIMLLAAAWLAMFAGAIVPFVRYSKGLSTPRKRGR